MTTPFDDLIRTTLSDIAEEAIPVNLTTRAFEQVRRRRMMTVTLGAATAVAAVLIGAPLAFAGGDGTQPEAPTQQPADPRPVSTIAPPAPVPVSPSTPPAPQVSPVNPTLAPPAPPQVTPANPTLAPPQVTPSASLPAPYTTIAPPSPPRAAPSTSPAR